MLLLAAEDERVADPWPDPSAVDGPSSSSAAAAAAGTGRPKPGGGDAPAADDDLAPDSEVYLPLPLTP